MTTEHLHPVGPWLTAKSTALRWVSFLIVRGTVAILGLLLALRAGLAEEAPTSTVSTSDLANLSLEQLINVQVTSVSKKPERLSQASAAISVITQDDIRRSGATTIAEAL